ncbi:hypothetical protein, partial [Sansalvadorimonas verongulae]|uniref:hypothetical protein n=1 Tax=Sansalvadorimonas verongulae TaxID=2172824 RepID=UPI0018AD1935
WPARLQTLYGMGLQAAGWTLANLEQDEDDETDMDWQAAGVWPVPAVRSVTDRSCTSVRHSSPQVREVSGEGITEPAHFNITRYFSGNGFDDTEYRLDISEVT